MIATNCRVQDFFCDIQMYHQTKTYHQHRIGFRFRHRNHHGTVIAAERMLHIHICDIRVEFIKIKPGRFCTQSEQGSPTADRFGNTVVIRVLSKPNSGNEPPGTLPGRAVELSKAVLAKACGVADII